MALLYRAIWRDALPDLLERGSDTFQAWLLGKNLHIEIPEDGASVEGAEEVEATRVEDGDLRALRLRLSEDRTIGGAAERWTTTAHWMTDGAEGWVWVDLEWDSDDAFNRRPDVAAPKLVGSLLDAMGAAGGSVLLGPKPIRVASGDVGRLVDWVYDESRSAPLVVFSVDVAVGPEGYADRVKATASRLAGCADVRMLTAESGQRFDEAMRGAAMSVFDGAARVYLPGVPRSDPRPWRHRYLQAFRLTDDPKLAAARISRLVLPRMVAQRPPPLYRTKVKQLLDRAGGESTDWQAMAMELDDTATKLGLEVNELREERDLAMLEALESERLAADAVQRLEALRAHLRVNGGQPEVVEQEAPPAQQPSSCAEAVELGRTLENIVIHADAPRDIDRMDESPDSELWGQRIWNHLQSLDAYAAARGPGFKFWCETSGDDRALSSKFISMTESEFVSNNQKLRAYRLLPVSTDVDPSGKVEMFAHIKSVQGGGMQIPRIYFHDDAKGKTGKVHVGFIGPHDLMPNKQTN